MVEGESLKLVSLTSLTRLTMAAALPRNSTPQKHRDQTNKVRPQMRKGQEADHCLQLQWKNGPNSGISRRLGFGKYNFLFCCQGQATIVDPRLEVPLLSPSLLSHLPMSIHHSPGAALRIDIVLGHHGDSEPPSVNGGRPDLPPSQS